MYTSMNGQGTLSAYYYNAGRMEMDLVCKSAAIAETSTLYQNYSLVKLTGVGFIFHMPGSATTTLYSCNSASNVETWPTTFTTSAVTYDFSLCAAYLPSASPCGTQAARAPPIFCGSASMLTANVILRQARDDPATYAIYSDPTNPLYQAQPPIWGWFDNNYFMKFTYAAGALKVEKSIEFIKGLNLLGVTSSAKGNVYAEQLDVGNQFLAIMSPTQCGATYAVSAILNPSVYIYDLSGNDFHDLVNCDCNFATVPDGLDDNSGCTPVYVDPLASPLV